MKKTKMKVRPFTMDKDGIPTFEVVAIGGEST